MRPPEEPDDTPASYREKLHAGAATALGLVEPTIGEVRTLLARLLLLPRVKVPAHTGLPAFARQLEREEKALGRCIEDDEAAEQGSDDDDDEEEWVRLRKLAGRMDASVIAIEQMHQLWGILKRCRSIRAVNQTFQSSTKEARRQAIASNGSTQSETPQGKDRAVLHRTLKEKGRVEVHVVDNGYEWLDVRPVSLDRLARQMTDAGWGWGEYERGDAVDEEEWESVLLAKQVKRLAEAARLNRCEYRIPRVRVALPNVRRGVNEDVDVFLEQLVKIDPHVEIVIEDGGSAFLQGETPELEEVLDRLVGDELEELTPVINLDHTILIDLISDITHSKLEPQPWQARTTQLQIIEENATEGGIMAKALYPILRGRKLICTKEAAEHFHDVLRTVGTTTERQRGHLLIPNPSSSSPLAVSAAEAEDAPRLHERFCALSIHPPPSDFQIPISILPEETDFETAVRDGRLPRLALDVARCGGFKSAKLSIYMHGWTEGLVTVTSNKEIRGQIRTWVEANRREGEEAALGPRIYRFDMTRNLLAKSATPPEGWEGDARTGDGADGE